MNLTPRHLEDLVVRCLTYGAFPSSTPFGERDWLYRQRRSDFDAWRDQAEAELSRHIRAAKGEPDEGRTRTSHLRGERW